jgi:20S proteasome alpha/beta subunit
MQGYRTYIAAGLVATFGVLASTDWIGFMNDPKAGAVAIGSALLMAVMRSITTTPPGKA